MNLVERAKGIILAPAKEWEVISQETTTVQQLFLGYVVILAAISPVANFLGMSIFGIGVPFLGSIHVSPLSGLVHLIVSYVLGLVGVFVLGVVVNVLAPSFGGQKDSVRSMQVAVYAITPAWVAGVLHLIPALGVLVLIAGLYSIYVLYLGLPVLTQCAKDKAAVYTIAVVVVAIVVGVVIGTVTSAVGLGMGALGSLGGSSLQVGSSDNAALDSLDRFGKSMDAANRNMEAAKASGDPQAQAKATMNALGAVMGAGNAKYDAIDQQVLKAMLPDSLGPLRRTASEAEKSGMGTIQVSTAKGTYSDGQGRTIRLTVTDVAGVPLLAAAWSMVEVDKETETGYEKVSKSGGRPTLEKMNKPGMNGEYSVVIGDRFVVDAEGEKVDMATLKLAAAAVDLDKLESMRGVGAKQ